MTNYNTFIVYDCKMRKNILVTSSARKAKKTIYVGSKIEVWNDNKCVETIYNRNIGKINKYVSIEKQYIAEKQHKAELKNKRRKRNGL